MKTLNKLVIFLLLFIASNLIFSAEYKITSSKSGFCVLYLKELFNLDNDFSDKFAKNLHLFHNGTEIPIYYHNSAQSDLITSQDYIIFINNPVETLDIYSKQEAFYLKYDASYEGLQMKNLEFANSFVENIESLPYNFTLETDSIYYYWDAKNYLPNRFEKWYWKKLIDHPRGTGVSSLEHTAYLKQHLLLNTPADSLTIRIYFSTLVNDTTITLHNIDRKLGLIINNDTLAYHQWDSLVDNKCFEARVNGSKLFQGVNELKILNMSVDVLRSDIGIDRIEILGNLVPAPNINFSSDVSPVSLDVNRSIIHETGKLNAPSKLSLGVWSDSLLLVYDTISRSIATLKGKGITKTLVNTKRELNFTSILLNDSLYTSGEAGIHILSLSPATTTAISNYFPNYHSGVLNYLSSLPDSTVVCMAINTGDEVSPAFKQYLSGLGLQLINSYNNTFVYTCSYKKGSGICFENSNIGKIDTKGEFADSYCRGYMGEILLSKDNNYSLLASAFSDLEDVSYSITAVNSIDLRDINNTCEAIFIYHKDFEIKSKEYANYRISQGIKVITVDVEDVYKEFNHGKKSPYAIKDFLYYAKNNWNSSSDLDKSQLKYCLFIGDASHDARLCNEYSGAIDFIPTYGQPETDYWFGSFNELYPDLDNDIIIGRIPVSNNTQLENYIAKVKSYESLPSRPWNKNFLYISGGKSQAERDRIKNFATQAASMLNNSSLCIDTVLISRKSEAEDSELTSELQKDEILYSINSGAMLTTFNGHGADISYDMWGWPVNTLNNNNKFGVLATMTCNSGTFAKSPLTGDKQTCVNEDYILSYSDRGFIAALGSTTVTTAGSGYELMYYMNEGLINTKLRKLGDILYYAKSRLNYQSGSEYSKIMRYNFNILGDPLISFNIAPESYFYVIPDEISILNEAGTMDIMEDDKIAKIKFNVYNSGTKHEGNYKIQLEHIYSGSSKIEEQDITDICNFAELEFLVSTFNQPGLHTIVIDLGNGNTVMRHFNVFKNSMYPIEPLSYWTMANPLHFRFLKNINSETPDKYQLNLYEISQADTNFLYSSIDTEINIQELYIDWMPSIVLEEKPGISYLAEAIQLRTDAAGNDNIISTIKIPFNIDNQKLPKEKVQWKLQTLGELITIKLSNLSLNNTDSKVYLALEEGSQQGSAVLPLLGPAAKWDTLMLNGEHLAGIRIEVFGYNSDTYNTSSATFIKAVSGNDKIILSDIDFPYLELKFTFTNTLTKLYDIGAIFTPVPEILFAWSQTNFNDYSFLRGDTAFFNTKLENLSLHSDIENLTVSFNSNATDYGTLSSNTSAEYLLNVPTEYLSYSNTFHTEILNFDLYNFNNEVARAITITEDMAAPWLSVLFNNNEADSGKAHINSNPIVDIMLYDNSNLEVDQSALTVKLNGLTLGPDDVNDWNLEIMPKGRPLKAKLSFALDTLEDTENIFSITGRDASGNTVNETYLVSVTLNNSITNHFSFPNPAAANDMIHFEYELLRAAEHATIQLDIFDINGRRICSLTETKSWIQKGQIIWNLRNDSQQQVPMGIYIYRLTITTDSFIEPVYRVFTFTM